MKNALNNQVTWRHVFMACSKLEARGHLLHKTGTPPKHFSRECTYKMNQDVVYCNNKGLHMPQNFVVELFESH